MLQTDLQKLGLEKLALDDKQAKVYLALLELGEGNIFQIARKSGVKRTTVYDIVRSLMEKGMATSTLKGKKTIYISEDPRKIEVALEEKTAEFKKMLPELLSIANIFDKKPVIKFYEGLENLKDIYKDQLSYPNQEIVGWWASDVDVEEVNDDFFLKYLGPKRSERRISMRIIAPKTEQNLKYRNPAVWNQPIRLKYISNEDFPLAVEIVMYGNRKVAIISAHDKMGIVLESQKIYSTLKNIFELQWLSVPDEPTNHLEE